MTLHDYQATHGLTNARMCRLISEARTCAAESPVFEHRLERLKAGKARPTLLEIRLLQVATGFECDSYKS